MASRVVLVVSCMIVLTGCVDIPDEPVIPTWDVQISVALTNTSHSIRELVSDLASLPPEILDTLDLSGMTITFVQSVPVGSPGQDDITDSTLTGDFLRNVWQARIFAEVENATPVDLAVSVELLNSDDAPLLRMPGSDNTMNLMAAPVDETGKVGPSTTETTSLDLYDPEISTLESVETLRYSIDIRFPDGVSPAQVLTADSMSIRTWGTLWTTVAPN